MTDQNRNAQVALAGLLHDIGKIEQRARDDPWRPAPGLENENQPVHATYSIYFIQNNVPAAFRPAALPGAYHHRPERFEGADRELVELVSLADHLSAGERADEPDKSQGLPMQLVTIFDRLDPDQGAPSKKEYHYLPLGQAALQREALFPAGQASQQAARQAYHDLSEKLAQAARCQTASLDAYLENMLLALARFAWAVPSAYYHNLPDVSLYDHSRMTAALAVCLAEFPGEKIHRLLEASRRDFLGKAADDDRPLLQEPAALLVGGDLSGIQDFIYTISARHAARTLRGRSFYLQLLNEALLRFVLRRLELTTANVIYAGGGHFYLLAPLSAQGKLQQVQAEIARCLYRQHGPALYLALAGAAVPFNGFKAGSFPAWWDRMHAALSAAKRQRYTELGHGMFDLVFAPPPSGGNPENHCTVCGEDQHTVEKFDPEHEEQARICELCESFAEQIGSQLPKAQFLALGLGEPRPAASRTALDLLAEFGLQVQFLGSSQEQVALAGAERIVLWALGDPPDDQWPAAEAARGLHYTVRSVPPMSFDKLQQKAQGGFKRLGVLRMDVDDLGKVFRSRLGHLATLSRISTLSLQLSLFFEGWTARICADPPFAGLVYAVYAGGDDVFLVAPWDRIPDLAQRIRADLDAYTAGRKRLGLSAGMAFIGGKYPIHQAAEDAAAALELAKQRPGKDSFAFLGTAWPWSDFAQLAKKSKRLRRIVSGGQGGDDLDGPQAVLHILMQLAAARQQGGLAQGGRPVWGRWQWLGAYQLKRMAERYEKTSPGLAAELDKIRSELDQENYGRLPEWGAAARWTQLQMRKVPKNPEGEPTNG